MRDSEKELEYVEEKKAPTPEPKPVRTLPEMQTPFLGRTIAGKHIVEVGEVIEFSGTLGSSAIAAVMFDDGSYNVVGKNFDGTFTPPRANQYSWILRAASRMPNLLCALDFRVEVWVTPSTYLIADHRSGYWVFTGIKQMREHTELQVSAHLH